MDVIVNNMDKNMMVKKEARKCEICEKVWSNKQDQKKHFIDVHDDQIEKNINCDTCTKYFQTQQGLVYFHYCYEVCHVML